MIAPPPSRNAPCPCGSGRRYKDCHGTIAPRSESAPPSLDRLAQAANAAARGDFEAVASICDEVLQASPGHPVALQLLARGESEAGRPQPALSLLLDAARGLTRHVVPPAVAYGVWSALNAAFLDAVSGQDPKAAEERRAAYRAWHTGRRPPVPVTGRDVAVVLLLTPASTPDAARVSIDALLAQAHRPAELVVVTIGNPPALEFVRARAHLVPFEVTLLGESQASVAAAINAGIARSRAPWIVVLEPPHAFAPRHLADLLDAVTGAGALWAFSDCILAPFGDVPPALVAARSAALDATGTSIAKSDALGFAFLDQSFAATGTGAVMFDRELALRIGGCRLVPGHEMWDLCLRMLWESEPVHVAERSYRHAVSATESPQSMAEREAAQLSIFRDYYARACDENVLPPNRYAPSLSQWGLSFVRRMFQVGHVLMVDVAVLERLRTYIAAVVESAAPMQLTPGINLLGFAFGEFGLGESLRALARACEAGGVPFVVKDIEQQLATRQADRSVVRHLADDIRHRLSLMCVNPDMLKPVRGLLERTRSAGGRSVGYWYWELETTPRAWDPAFAAVDEVWCATEFVAAAIRRATSKPVVKIPPPIEVAMERRWGRGHFGLPADRFLFLFTFDYNSFVKRKNPEAVIAAFRAAFPRGRDDVGLVVKSVNGTRRPDRVEAILRAIDGDARIVHLDRFLSRDESYGLIEATDAYVSLHRAEGLGLGLAEAMALGKPAIATGYSGNLEFMHEGNSFLVDYKIVPVAPGEYLFDDERFVWADPDVEAAARQMRAVAGDPALRSRIAAAGREYVGMVMSRERAAAAIRRRLEELGIVDTWLAPTATVRSAPPAEALERGGESWPAGTFVSYAQNGEDALLAHVLSDVAAGFYVDVGANDPDVHSVTRAFYERGWHGVNVEPVAEWHERLLKARPRDVNLRVAVDRTSGVIALYEFEGTGLSTVDAGVAARHTRAGRTVNERTINAVPLAAIFDAHAPGDVHFLKIDVEGAEASVLAGADLQRHRPWIVVVEATEPLTGIPSQHAWESKLLEAGYIFTHDDGFNRYYVCAERPELARRFADRAGMPHVVSAAEAAAAATDLPEDQRFDASSSPFLDCRGPEPSLEQPTSQLCTAGQFAEAAYREGCRALREPPMMHRRQWEYVWIMRCLEMAGVLGPGRRGLGFGQAGDPLVAAVAARGCAVVAGMAPDRGTVRLGAAEPAQGDTLGELNARGLCTPQQFRSLASQRPLDMNFLPGDLQDFDFVWSCSSIEHLGSVEHALAFLLRAMRCVRRGGIALHTTAFNLSSDGSTVECAELSVIRRRDVERLEKLLERDGYRLWPVRLHPGTRGVDRYVDVPPYRPEPHLKVRFGRYVVTSIGLAIARAG